MLFTTPLIIRAIYEVTNPLVSMLYLQNTGMLFCASFKLFKKGIHDKPFIGTKYI